MGSAATKARKVRQSRDRQEKVGQNEMKIFQEATLVVRVDYAKQASTRGPTKMAPFVGSRPSRRICHQRLPQPGFARPALFQQRNPTGTKRRVGMVTRKLRLLRAHGLIRKVSGTHRYVISEKRRPNYYRATGARQANVEQLTALAA